MQIIRLGDGRAVSIGQYVAGVKIAKLHPNYQYSRGLCGWWPVTGREIVREFFDGVQDRINQHLTIRTLSESRLQRILSKRIKHQCRNCGTLIRYTPSRDLRFCNGRCKKEYDWML